MEGILEASEEHLPVLLEMGLDLWSEENPEELRNTLLEILYKQKNKIFLYPIHQKIVGFIYVSVRTDYVEGSTSSPVGYVEGIYVKPEYRRKGISSKLLTVGEEWAKNIGCKEIASDIYLGNEVSYHFHKNQGFKEAGRLICFIKDLK